MHLVMLHGMGRTPLSMLCLRQRLRNKGHKVSLLGYLPAVESLSQVSGRLVNHIQSRVGQQPYALVGHSLGCVIIRHTLPRLEQHIPSACFFLAPPMIACKAARYFSRLWPYRLLTGEMGQLLAKTEFMQQLPWLENTTIYAGISGPQKNWLPFGMEENDGILSISEACGPHSPRVMKVHHTHTLIMNSRLVSEDISAALANIH